MSAFWKATGSAFKNKSWKKGEKIAWKRKKNSSKNVLIQRRIENMIEVEEDYFESNDK